MGIENVPPEEATRELIEGVTLAWREKRTERLAAQKIVDALEEDERKYSKYIVACLQAQKYEGFLVGGRITSVSTKEIHVCEDRALFDKFIVENNALDCLQFRISEAGVKAREQEGIVIPGLGTMETYTLSDKNS